MKPTTPDRIRNVALISHGGAGKTSLAEAMLFDAGAISRLGTVEAGTTTLDWDPDEHKRNQSINLSIGSLDHDGVRITLVDTPGYADFQADVVEALAAVDAAIVVIDASAGVEVGTEEVWNLADARGLPRLVFINKMDRENANYDAALDQLKARFGPKIAPVYLPIGSAETFRGYVDVIEEHATIYEGGSPKEVPIPEELEGIEHTRRDALVEAAAEASDDLMMKYLDGEAFTDEEIEAALHKGTREGSVVRGAFATRVAYVAVEGPVNRRSYRLIVSDADGGDERIVFGSPDPIMSPTWSPDGKSIAYVSFHSGLSASLRADARHRGSGAGVGQVRHQRRARVLPGRFATCARAFQAGRQRGRLCPDPRDSGPPARHRRRLDRHRASLGAGRAVVVLHVGPCRRAPGVPGRDRAGRARESRDFRGQLQRTATAVA